MLADLSLIGCYNSSYMNQEERNRVLLASAKRNLLSIAFFGLTEFQKVNNKINYYYSRRKFKLTGLNMYSDTQDPYLIPE